MRELYAKIARRGMKKKQKRQQKRAFFDVECEALDEADKDDIPESALGGGKS